MTEPRENKWTVVALGEDGDVRYQNRDSRSDAQHAKSEALDLGAVDAKLFPPGELPGDDPFDERDGPDVVEYNNAEEAAAKGGEEGIKAMENRPSINEDPVDWLPSHFIDDIQGVPVVNRKGYCVLASQYGVSVVAEPETVATPEDDFAAFSAAATTDDGKTYTGYGTASTERGDDAELLNELAETRAMKRAVAWATGIGMTALEELQGKP